MAESDIQAVTEPISSVNIRWRHRRRMAYCAIVGGMAVPVLAIIFKVEISGWAIPFYGFCGIVVGAYIGGAVVDDKWQKPPDKQ